MRVVAIKRCSTDDQISTSLPEQERAITGFAAERNHQILAWLDEPGLSAFCSTTDEIKRKLPMLWRYINEPPIEYDALLYYDESRLLRAPPRLCSWLETVALENGIQLINCMRPDQKVDSVGDDVARVVDRHVAWEHSKVLRVKSVAGARQACEQGYRVGGPAPIGYMRVVYRNGQVQLHPDGSLLVLGKGDRKPNSREYKVKLHINEAEASTVREVFSLYATGEGLGAVARILNDRKMFHRDRPWTKASLRDVLISPTYRGHLVYHKHRRKTGKGQHDSTDWTICENAHEPLCTPEQAAYIDARLGTPGRKLTRRRSDRYLLNGKMMRCKRCNSHLVGWTRGSGCRAVYICVGYKNKLTDCGIYCPVDAERLETAVVAGLASLLTSDELLADIEDLISVRDRAAEALSRELKGTNRKIENVVDAIARLGADVELETKLLNLRAEKMRTQTELEKIRASANEPRAIIEEYRHCHGGLIGSDRDLQRQLVKELLAGPILLDPDAREIQAHVGILVGTPTDAGECTLNGTRYGIRRDRTYFRHRPIIQGMTRYNRR